MRATLRRGKSLRSTPRPTLHIALDSSANLSLVGRQSGSPAEDASGQHVILQLEGHWALLATLLQAGCLPPRRSQRLPEELVKTLTQHELGVHLLRTRLEERPEEELRQRSHGWHVVPP